KVHYFCVLCRELSVLCVAGLLSVTGGSQTLLTLVAEPGDDVTIWSNHTLDEPAHIFWFRHTNVSVPHLLTCQQYKLYSSPASCSFIPQSSRMVMTANSDKTSLSITEVNYTDSGLYYCCIQRDIYITFSNATFLLVRGNFILQEQGAEQVNYAALQFPSKTNRRSGGHSEEPQVLYSSVRH
uniref:Ig-like domain-containing protein n=1 Tax=Pygocentrus nattereri TaxID=42514 RepID=A0A3B4CKW0_PYGNA